MIAASRCFADDAFHHLRTTVLSIARNVELSGPDIITRTGAKLALELFADGIGIEHPNFRRQLAVHALDLLELGPEDFEDELPMLWEDVTADPVSKRLSDHIREETTQTALSAWKFLFRSAPPQREIVAGKDLARWPAGCRAALNVLRQARMAQLPELSQQITRISRECDPVQVMNAMAWLRRTSFMEPEHNSRDKADDELSFLRALPRFASLGWEGALTCPILASKKSGSILTIRVIPTGGSKGLALIDKSRSNIDKLKWLPLLRGADFALSPSRNALAEYLREVASNSAIQVARSFIHILPWPIAGLLDAVTTKDQAVVLATEVNAGRFGDYDDWMSAEKRWSSDGIAREDLLVARGGQWFDHRVATIGSPGIISHVPNTFRGDNPDTRHRVAMELCHIASAIENATYRERLAYLAQYTFLHARDDRMETLGTTDSFALLEALSNFSTEALSSSIVRAFSDDVWSDPAFVELFSSFVARAGLDWAGDEIDVVRLIELYNANTERRGLLIPIVAYFASRTQWLEPTPKKIHVDALVPKQSDLPMVLICVLLLRLHSRGNLERELIHRMAETLKEDYESLDIHCISEFIQNPNLDIGSRVTLCETLVSFLEVSSPYLAVRFRDALRRNLDARQSRLVQQGIWTKELFLPVDAYKALSINVS